MGSRFRLRIVEQCERTLRAYDGIAFQHDREGFRQPLGRVCVSGVLRCHCHQHPFEEFDSLVFERATLHEPIVFPAKKRPNPFGLDIGDVQHGTSIAMSNRQRILQTLQEAPLAVYSHAVQDHAEYRNTSGSL